MQRQLTHDELIELSVRQESRIVFNHEDKEQQSFEEARWQYLTIHPLDSALQIAINESAIENIKTLLDADTAFDRIDDINETAFSRIFAEDKVGDTLSKFVLNKAIVLRKNSALTYSLIRGHQEVIDELKNFPPHALRPTPFATLDLSPKLRITIAQGALTYEEKRAINPQFFEFIGDMHILGEGHIAKTRIGINLACRLGALKVIDLHSAQASEFNKRKISIINERAALKAMGQLLGSHDDQHKHLYYELQELHAGVNLADYLDILPSLEPIEALRLMLSACTEAYRLHKCGYVHHDLASRNFIKRESDLAVIDFDYVEKVGGLCTRAADDVVAPGWKPRSIAKVEFDIYSLGLLLEEIGGKIDAGKHHELIEDVQDIINAMKDLDPNKRPPLPVCIQALLKLYQKEKLLLQQSQEKVFITNFNNPTSFVILKDILDNTNQTRNYLKRTKVPENADYVQYAYGAGEELLGYVRLTYDSKIELRDAKEQSLLHTTVKMAKDGTLELVAKVGGRQPTITYDLWGSLFKLAKLPIPQFIQVKMQNKSVEQKAAEVKASAPVVSVARRKSVPTLFRFEPVKLVKVGDMKVVDKRQTRSF